jgi:hypothetical protein
MNGLYDYCKDDPRAPSTVVPPNFHLYDHVRDVPLTTDEWEFDDNAKTGDGKCNGVADWHACEPNSRMPNRPENSLITGTELKTFTDGADDNAGVIFGGRIKSKFGFMLEDEPVFEITFKIVCKGNEAPDYDHGGGWSALWSTATGTGWPSTFELDALEQTGRWGSFSTTVHSGVGVGLQGYDEDNGDCVNPSANYNDNCDNSKLAPPLSITEGLKGNATISCDCNSQPGVPNVYRDGGGLNVHNVGLDWFDTERTIVYEWLPSGFTCYRDAKIDRVTGRIVSTVPGKKDGELDGVHIHWSWYHNMPPMQTTHTFVVNTTVLRPKDRELESYNGASLTVNKFTQFRRVLSHHVDPDDPDAVPTVDCVPKDDDNKNTEDADDTAIIVLSVFVGLLALSTIALIIVLARRK